MILEISLVNIILSFVGIIVAISLIRDRNKLVEQYQLLKEFYTYERVKRAVEDKGLILVMLKQTPKGHKFTVDLEGVDTIW